MIEVIITATCFGEEKAQAISAIKDLVDQLSIGLELNSLEKIVIPEDFGRELEEFQERHGLLVGFTNNDMGIAVGKTLSYRVGECLRQAIFFNKGLSLSLFSNDELTRYEAVHLLHHELCHIHNNKMTYDIPEKENGDTLVSVVRGHASTIWSEYAAERISSL